MIRAFCLGFRDGFRSPFALDSGVTWRGDDRRNRAYDVGANWGQYVGRIASDRPRYCNGDRT